MKEIFSNVLKKVGIESNRTKNITKHVMASFIYKGGSILATFLMVPLTINFLDTENYGIWLTLSSFISWFSFFDIGLGNGLRNKFAEAKANGDLIQARGYVSTAYYTIGAICLILALVFIVLNFFIDWSIVFNTTKDLNKDLSILIPIVFTFFCLQLVAKLISTIYTADQNHSMQGKINFYTQVISLVTIWVITFINKSSLLLFGTLFSALPLLILLGFNFFAFSTTYKFFSPALSLWKKQYLKDIFGLGIIFFIVQISGIILYSTDNIIISNLFSPKEVVPYNIAYKYFSISTMVFGIIVTPFWSSITEAYQKNDYNWIKKSIANMNKLAILFMIIIVFMIFFSNFFYHIWVGSKVKVPTMLTIYTGIFFLLCIYVTPFTIFLNGTGKIKLQALQGLIAAVLNIPLSILFAVYFNLGPAGVIFSTVICFIPSVILNPLQYSKIISKSATGIWNK